MLNKKQIKEITIYLNDILNNGYNTEHNYIHDYKKEYKFMDEEVKKNFKKGYGYSIIKKNIFSINPIKNKTIEKLVHTILHEKYHLIFKDTNQIKANKFAKDNLGKYIGLVNF